MQTLYAPSVLYRVLSVRVRLASCRSETTSRIQQRGEQAIESET